MNDSLFLSQPRITEMMKSAEEGKSIQNISSEIYDEAKSKGNDRIWVQVSHRFNDFEKRCAFITQLGMRFYQEKVIFILDKFNKADVPQYSLSFINFNEFGFEALVSLIVQTLSVSLDIDDMINIDRYGLETVANQIVESETGALNCNKKWWQIGIYNEIPIGFVFPVKFEGCDKDGLIEGSIKFYGVLPSFRGKGFGKELLNKGCEVLNDIGMWRIFNDVDSENIPSLKAFISNGHREADKIAKYQMPIS